MHFCHVATFSKLSVIWRVIAKMCRSSLRVLSQNMPLRHGKNTLKIVTFIRNIEHKDTWTDNGRMDRQKDGQTAKPIRYSELL